ncbi:class I SAM-dependent methyltransferase [Magnetospirillum sulfuroxidans]|uniref:Class I SAM-dependent methyltransferase n=1 Tax=Magnetospirillum sulfuroxidans TaxID=611300 RepID=A0ABS5I7H7_9PROT|nr:class I SAM-dependent methyltransferase [Magnetospirillum sulfuroxidans]MBR9970201.1 class I SAM-dependent methyltransferase [Magnetospirillum sulfuroxidans]
MSELLAPFSDPQAVARYAEGPPRFVPGFADLHRMAAILLAEHMPEAAELLVLGAGGGLELKSFAQAHAGWRFVGVDPAIEMLKLAERMVGQEMARVRLLKGYIDDAPEGPFDGATCFLTLHFLGPEERLRTLKEIRRRLKPGAPFVVAHSSFPQTGSERGTWLSRYAAFALTSGSDPEKVHKMRDAVEAHLSLLTPEHDAALLAEAGFSNVAMFYAAFTWRGWVAYA